MPYLVWVCLAEAIAPLFAFAAGEELAEHTSVRPAIVHLRSGEADLPKG